MNFRKVRVVCLTIAVVLCAGWMIHAWWKSRALQQRLLAASHVTVVGLKNSFPPELTIEFENAGDAIIGQTHFRLAFEVDGKEISRADEDHGDFKPGERRRIILRSRSPNPAPSSVSYPASAKYTLVVIPEWKEQLPVIAGEFRLNR